MQLYKSWSTLGVMNITMLCKLLQGDLISRHDYLTWIWTGTWIYQLILIYPVIPTSCPAILTYCHVISTWTYSVILTFPETWIYHEIWTYLATQIYLEIWT